MVIKKRVKNEMEVYECIFIIFIYFKSFIMKSKDYLCVFEKNVELKFI